jgi:hypothetical protein
MRRIPSEGWIMRSPRCTGVGLTPHSLGIRVDLTGPTNELDRAYLTWGYREQRRSAYNQGFRTFGFEWNENYLWTCTSDPTVSCNG